MLSLPCQMQVRFPPYLGLGVSKIICLFICVYYAIHIFKKPFPFLLAVPSIVSQSAALEAKAVVEKENVKEAKEALDLPVPKDDDTKVTASAPSSLSRDSEPLVLKPTSDAKAEVPKSTSVAKAEVPKLSYASMVCISFCY